MCSYMRHTAHSTPVIRHTACINRTRDVRTHVPHVCTLRFLSTGTAEAGGPAEVELGVEGMGLSANASFYKQDESALTDTLGESIIHPQALPSAVPSHKRDRAIHFNVSNDQPEILQ